MKKQMLNKLLVLKKETVAVLHPFELNCVQGGTICPPRDTKLFDNDPNKESPYTYYTA